jgi:hypothetical protein
MKRILAAAVITVVAGAGLAGGAVAQMRDRQQITMPACLLSQSLA